MKKQRDDLKNQLSQPTPATDPDRRTHPNCGNQPTIHHRNTKEKAQRIEKKPLEPLPLSNIVFCARDFGAASATMSFCCICFW
jgi:hypothetical protein